jgi:hypothetical protein
LPLSLRLFSRRVFGQTKPRGQHAEGAAGKKAHRGPAGPQAD